MKKIIKSVLILSQTLLLASCNNLFNSGDGKAYIRASIENLERKILPVNVSQNDITKAEIEYFISDDYDTRKTKEWLSNDKKNAIEIMKADTTFAVTAGTYDFSLCLYVSDPEDSSIYHCTQRGDLYRIPLSEGENEISFTTAYNTDEDAVGNISAKFTWAEEARVFKARASLIEFAAGNNSAEIESSAVEYKTFETEKDSAVAEDETAKTLNYITYEKNGIQVGTYWLQVLLYQSEDDDNPSVWFDMIKVLAGCTTSAENNGSERITNINTLYNISYDTNGGEWAESYTPTVKHNSNTGVTLPTSDFISREGYTFGGWIICDSEGNEQEGLNGGFAHLGDISIGITEDYYLKADWIKQMTYTINYTFENADDDNYTENESYTESDTIDIWYGETAKPYDVISSLLTENSDLVKTFEDYEYDDIDYNSIEITENTVTASLKYKLVTVDYEFNANGGTFSDDSETLSKNNQKYGSDLSITNPAKENYVFAGWSVSLTTRESQTAVTGTVSELPATYGILYVTNEEGVTSELDKITSATFTAIWEEETGTKPVIDVTFDVTDNDIEVTNNLENLTDTTIILTADTGYESYTWKVENVVQEETSNVLTIDASSWATGIYDVSLQATKDSRTDSYTMQIHWTKPEVEITLKLGSEINTLVKSLSDSVSSIKYFAKSTSAPATAENYLDDTSKVPVWFDTEASAVYYYVPEGETVYLNSNCFNMFTDLSAVESIDLSGFDGSRLTSLQQTFANCKALTTLTLCDNWDTSKVTKFSSLFSSCSNLTSIDLSKFDTSSAITLASMFYGCSNLTTLDLSTFDTSKVTNLTNMFFNCSRLTTIYVSASFVINTSTLEDGGDTNVFSGCSRLSVEGGTTYDSEHTDATYAHVDGGEDNPGYFTLKS